MRRWANPFAAGAGRNPVGYIHVMGQGAFRRVGVAVAAVACAAALTAPSAGAAKYEVQWTLFDAMAAQGKSPGSSPPGANDFDCKLTKAHPEPVILAHGLLANQTVNWNT